MTSLEEARAWLTLTLNPKLTAANLRLLLARYGLPEEVLAQPRSRVAAELGKAIAAALATPPAEALLDAALAWLAQPNHHLLTLASPAYPKALLDLADPPLVLFVVGNPALLNGDALAIVGARRATAAGKATARAFAEALAQAGVTVVSGLAQGIDAAAHEGAIARTVAVIGTGADRVYPAAHRQLAQRIAQHGAIVSEFPLGTPALPHHFPRRNRLIAALARGTLVVEAAVNSGSLITARLAAELGRDVFAIPGSIHNPLAKGCHRLIRDGAKLVECVEDILEEWRWQTPPLPFTAHPSDTAAGNGEAVGVGASARQRTQQPESTHRDDPLWQALGFDPVPFDALVARTGLSSSEVSARLLEWELEGRVAKLPGDCYQRLS
ncbi:DNA processing protein DprA [Hydrogenophilus thermoluteolus]|uniref:DNA-processing protein DprA n=1 Tax=Hydrogenophilus thermoluteolus TaxID=297 RepID=UPI0024A4AB2F|nr:DNA-processing protein DprA [Hydrogenophilus thermoluteolus]GLW60533.1 DNA processing protein DprA [Hydrogenophilus thermoluteolus]